MLPAPAGSFSDLVKTSARPRSTGRTYGLGGMSGSVKGLVGLMASVLGFGRTKASCGLVWLGLTHAPLWQADWPLPHGTPSAATEQPRLPLQPARHLLDGHS